MVAVNTGDKSTASDEIGGPNVQEEVKEINDTSVEPEAMVGTA